MNDSVQWLWTKPRPHPVKQFALGVAVGALGMLLAGVAVVYVVFALLGAM